MVARGNKKPGLQLKTVNLKHDLPGVEEALSRLENEIAIAQKQGIAVLKVVHGYGSSGVGGDIRMAVQARLRQMAEGGRIGGYIFGENWSKSDDATWRLLQRRAELKQDRDLGRGNPGFTVVILT